LQDSAPPLPRSIACYSAPDRRPHPPSRGEQAVASEAYSGSSHSSVRSTRILSFDALPLISLTSNATVYR